MQRERVQAWIHDCRYGASASVSEEDAAAIAAKICAELTAECVQSIDGLHAADGSAITVSEVTTDNYFAHLTLKIGAHLIEMALRSTPAPPMKRRH